MEILTLGLQHLLFGHLNIIDIMTFDFLTVEGRNGEKKIGQLAKKL